MRDDPTVETNSATATFLFTDIEGSTQLLKTHRAEYARILADHHSILREQFAAHGGREIDNQGDSFFVAFPRAKDAVLAAAAAQRALTEHSWPGEATVSVRMGIHTGEAELTVDRYVGLSVHRAARISAVGHGGQVLVSQSTVGMLDDEEGNLPGVALRDLGEHRLKDISRPVRLYQLDVDGLPTTFPRLADMPAEGSRRKRVAALGAVALLVAGIVAAALFVTHRGGGPPEVVPNAVVRVDPTTLEPAKVVPVGAAPDLVVIAGGYVWVTHYILRDSGPEGVRNIGGRTLTRVDPATGDVTVVGGGLAPCGITPDPSGDVWVANCFEPRSNQSANVVRVNASTLAFKATWTVPFVRGSYYRGLVFGGGSLWASGGAESEKSVIQVDPRTGARATIRIDRDAGALAWAEGYGDLWITNFGDGSLTRLHVATGATQIVDVAPANPGSAVVDGDTVWVSAWFTSQVSRLRAVGPSSPRSIPLPTLNGPGVWNVAAGAGSIWATMPRAGAVWRIDPNTNQVTRITIPHLPVGVAANANQVWVTVREE